MWQCSHHSDLYSSLASPEESGWTIDQNGIYIIDWEAPDATDRIKSNIEFLMKGCSYKKGCASNKCGCKRKERYRGPGCECQGCVNQPGVYKETIQIVM